MRVSNEKHWYGLVLAAAIASGCGAQPAEGENAGIEMTSSALTNTWQGIPLTNGCIGGNTAIGNGTTLSSKKSSRFWAMGIDDGTGHFHQDTWTGLDNNFAGWCNQDNSSTAAAPPGSTNWYGNNCSTCDNNVVSAYIDFNGTVHVGDAMQANYVYTWHTMAGPPGNSALVRPALAWANGFLYLFVKSTSNVVFFKRNTVSATVYNFSGWDASWTQIPNGAIGGGLGAGRIGSNLIIVGGTASDGTQRLFFANVTASTRATSAYHQVGNGAFSAFSSPALATHVLGNTVGIVAIGTNGHLFTSTTTDGINFATWGQITDTGCTSPGDPGITENLTNNNFAIAALCNFQEQVFWLQLP